MERAHPKINWHTSVLPPATLRALDFFSKEAWLPGPWYLAGGTALTLQVGHRSSEDLDFFTHEKDFAPNDVLKYLSEPDWKSGRVEAGTVYGEYRDAKVSFIAYPFFVPKDKMLEYGNVSMLTIRDIAVMKVVALSQRGRKRDFLDLYWYSKNEEPLADVLRRLPDQYPTVAHDYHHILKSFVYFLDAEDDPMPVLHFKADWNEVKKYFRREIPRIAEKLLGLRKESA